MASLIQEGLYRGHSVECWHNYDQSMKGIKGHLFPDIGKAPTFKKAKGTLTFRKVESRKIQDKEIFSDKAVDIVVVLSFSQLPNDILLLEKMHLRFCVIMHAADTFFEIAELSEKIIKSSFKKYLFLYSREWLKLGKNFLKKYYPDHLLFLDPKNTTTAFIGNTTFHDNCQVNNDESIRKKFEIPEGKEIVIYLPFPYYGRNKKSAWEFAFSGIFIKPLFDKTKNHRNASIQRLFRWIKKNRSFLLRLIRDPLALKWFLNGYNEPRVFRAIKKFCDKNDLFLIVKPRLKFHFPEYIIQNADLVVWDDESQQFPSTYHELLSVAKLTTGYFSYAVLESIYFGVPFLNIEVPDCQFADESHQYWFPKEKGSIFSFSGAVHNWSIPRIIYEISNKSVEDLRIQPDSQQHYISKFIGSSDGKAAVRFYNDIKRDKCH